MYITVHFIRLCYTVLMHAWAVMGMTNKLMGYQLIALKVYDLASQPAGD